MIHLRPIDAFGYRGQEPPANPGEKVFHILHPLHWLSFVVLMTPAIGMTLLVLLLLGITPGSDKLPIVNSLVRVYHATSSTASRSPGIVKPAAEVRPAASHELLPPPVLAGKIGT